MKKPPQDFDKELDLHESEWAKKGKRQPILGSGAWWFFRVTVPTLLIGGAFSMLAATYFKWAVPHLGVWWALGLFGAVSWLFIQFLLGPFIDLVIWLANLPIRLLRRR